MASQADLLQICIDFRRDRGHIRSVATQAFENPGAVPDGEVVQPFRWAKPNAFAAADSRDDVTPRTDGT